MWNFRAQVRQKVSVQEFYKGILFEQARKALYSTNLRTEPAAMAHLTQLVRWFKP